MFGKGIFGGLFDFNRDGKMDAFEMAADFALFNAIMDEEEDNSHDEFDTDYDEFDEDCDDDYDDDYDEYDEDYDGQYNSAAENTDSVFDQVKVLELAGLDYYDLELMDEEEREDLLIEAGLNPYDFFF